MSGYGTFYFAAGENEKTITVTGIPNPADTDPLEGDEFFFINLSNPRSPFGVNAFITGTNPYPVFIVAKLGGIKKMVYIGPASTPPAPIETGCCEKFESFNSFGISNFNIDVSDRDRIPKNLQYHVDWGDGTYERSGVLKWTPGKGYSLNHKHQYPAFQKYQAAILIENVESKRQSKCALVETIVASDTAKTATVTPTLTPTQTPTPTITPR